MSLPWGEIRVHMPRHFSERPGEMPPHVGDDVLAVMGPAMRKIIRKHLQAAASEIADVGRAYYHAMIPAEVLVDEEAEE